MKITQEFLRDLSVGIDEVLDRFDFEAFCRTYSEVKDCFKTARSLLEDALEEIEAGAEVSIKSEDGFRAIILSDGRIFLDYALVSEEYDIEDDGLIVGI